MPQPRLACFDLDNTLIDRDAAFLDWARAWCDEAGLGAAGVEWLTAHDGGGFVPRAELFAGLRQEFGSAPTVESYDREHPLFTYAENAVLEGLSALRDAGWRVAVVTNGTVVQQTLKLEHTGIAAVVDYCCVSEAVGVRKPEAEIFAIAAREAGAALDGWMVGDHPVYDVAGGQNSGLRTILVGDRRGGPVADHQVESVLDAFRIVIG
ncbi:HAD family hydrolase [Kribbella sp. NPDC056951]|uniref:HAD family hydrolase n=1 Tax=Kribbella sp. NPDC056951 TaxID=3345978 RepID=UPI003642B4A6